MEKKSAYELLTEKSKKIATYNSILALLHWDLETFMPPGGITARTEQIAQLSSLIHEEKTSKSYKNLLEKLVHMGSGNPKAKDCDLAKRSILTCWHQDFLRNTKQPSQFVKEFSQITSEASQVWAVAKKDNNFKLFLPFLEKIVTMNRKKADFFGFDDHPYDALLECYEPCMTSKRLTSIFDRLQKELKSLLKKTQSGKPTEDQFLYRKVPNEKQVEIGRWICDLLPTDPAYTRLDFSSHPFSTSLHPRDSRITTRILPHSFMSNIYSILHEEGHSMYEMGLPTEHWGTPLCEAVSLSIHESQSRWWEGLIGKSFPFWKHHYPQLRKKIPSILKDIPLERFYKSINQVKPSFIRVEADEVTYCLHIILRFELEKELISGKLAPVDLPDAWNAKFKELFGIKPKTHAEGCLQDIHWSLGDFGYFPTYALGNLLAAQFFGVFSKAHPDWEDRIVKGDLTFVRDWLKGNIHHWGKTYNMDELVKKVTGEPLSEKAFCLYLKKKYTEVYSC